MRVGLEDIACDVLVVGDGEPGRLAAMAAASAGAAVVLLDERVSIGGPSVARTHTSALAWGAWQEDGLLVTASVRGQAVHVRPRRLIVALGGFEIPVPVPGWTMPGVLTIDAARSHGVPPGQRVVLAGWGAELLAFAAELVAAEVPVVAVIQLASRPADVACGTETMWDTRVLACVGDGQFTALVARGPAGERRIDADLCVLSRGRQPELALARLLGAQLQDGQVRTGPDGRTSVPGLFMVRDSMACERGRLAGLAAAAELGFVAGDAGPLRDQIAEGERAAAKASYGQPSFGPIADEVIACRCEGVTAGRIRAVGGSAVATKRATRAGMGACGGRLCAAILGELCGVTDAQWDTPRAPVRLVPASAILCAHPDPHPPIWEQQPANPGRPVDRMAPALACDVAVVGGGAVGLCAALFLARAGRDVILLDRAEAGQGASSANAGSLHVQLLPYTFSDGDPGPLATALLLGPASVALWQELARDAGDDLGIRIRGGLVLARGADDLALLARKTAFERSRGVDVQVIGPDDVSRIAPNLAPVRGAAWCAAEGQIDPLRGTACLLRLARAAGVRVFASAEPQALEPAGAGWRIETAIGPVQAGQVVNTAGPGAVAVAQLAGVSLPVRTIVQQVIATARAPEQQLPLVAVAGRHLSLKQNYGGQLLVGGGWPGELLADGRARLLRSSLEGNLALAASVLPMLAAVDVVRAWATATVYLDRGPVMSATPGQPGLWHGVVSNGYTLGPQVGRMMAEAVLGRELLPAAFALA